MKKKSFSIIIKLIAVIATITILFSACGGDITTKTIRFKELNVVSSQYSDDALHTSVESSYKSVCKSGLIEMLFDEKTCTVAIRDTNSGNLWTTLPQISVNKQILSSPLEIVLSNGDETIYVLNSQENSVAFGNYSYNAGEDGVLVKYSISLDAETGKADISTLKDEQIRADLSVLYTLRDGSFYVNVSMNNLKLPKGVYLEEVRLMKDFGSYEQSGAEDYIFVPDGSGALIMTGIKDAEFEPVNLSVYENGCLVGAFGMKRGNGAFLCIIEQGDSIAEIHANKNSENSLNNVYASFNTTEILSEDGNRIKKTYGYKYQNEIILCYRFLSGKSATYSGMATACRENLIRNSVLSTKKLSVETKNIPLIVSVQGGYKNSKGKYSVLSSYEQTLSLVTLLKAKGVNNIYLRYNGLYDNANNGSSDALGDFSKKLGKEKDYNALYNYLNSQKFLLFIETDLLTYDYNGKGAKSVDGSKYKVKYDGRFPNPVSAQEFIKLSKLENRVEEILNASADLNFDGYAFNDIGAELYSDYSSNFYSRVSAKKEISAQIPVLTTSKQIMVDTGNIYSVKNADIVTKLSITPVANKENGAYVGIPFMQMLLHGISAYSSDGINSYNDMKTAFLKCVEYGCLPSARWYCTQLDNETDKKFYYDNNINDMVNYYTKINDALGNIQASRMTSHYKVQNGLYCTEYDNSIKVYVNYTDKDITINGIKIPSMDCVKI
ncbi:MAG: hypothetical protein J6Q50_05120 [Clostridia bacterium]|nr:hypothetical protein [Clostridia bacterium]